MMKEGKKADELARKLNQKPCEDAVSREAVLAIAGDSCLDLDSYEDTKEFCDDLYALLSKLRCKIGGRKMKVIIELNDDMLKEIRESDFGVARKIVRDFQATISDSIRNGEPISDGTALKKCHNENSDYADCDQFVCSNCGIELQDWHQVEREDDGDITYHEYEFRFCPNCGAKLEV